MAEGRQSKRRAPNVPHNIHHAGRALHVLRKSFLSTPDFRAESLGKFNGEGRGSGDRRHDLGDAKHDLGD